MKKLHGYICDYCKVFTHYYAAAFHDSVDDETQYCTTRCAEQADTARKDDIWDDDEMEIEGVDWLNKLAKGEGTGD